MRNSFSSSPIVILIPLLVFVFYDLLNNYSLNGIKLFLNKNFSLLFDLTLTLSTTILIIIKFMLQVRAIYPIASSLLKESIL